jgi:hypothetical protein
MFISVDWYVIANLLLTAFLTSGKEVGSVVQKLYCSEGLLFNSETEMCDLPDNVECPATVQPTSAPETCRDLKVFFDFSASASSKQYFKAYFSGKKCLTLGVRFQAFIFISYNSTLLN